MVEKNEHEIEKLLSEIEMRIGKIREIAVISENSKDKVNAHAREKILLEIYNEGGVVTSEKLREISRKNGMDARGLGGFFVGQSSIIRIGDGKRALTERGVEIVKSFMEAQELEEEE